MWILYKSKHFIMIVSTKIIQEQESIVVFESPYLCYMARVPVIAFGLYEVLVTKQLVYTTVNEACNLFCFIGYAKTFPNVFYPSKWDLVGQSHQIMHSMVVVRIVFYLWGFYGFRNYHFKLGGTQLLLCESELSRK